jgi:hypothetical protein
MGSSMGRAMPYACTTAHGNYHILYFFIFKWINISITKKIIGNLESIHEVIEDTAQCEELMAVQCPAPFSVDNSLSAPPASIEDPSSGPYDNICLDSSTENTVTGDDDMYEEQDDEYFIFAGGGSIIFHGYLLIFPIYGT